METTNSKTYSDCFMYKKYPQYNALLLDAIVHSDRINKEDKMFEDVIYEIKRTRTDSSILKVLTSKNTVLFIPGKVMPKSFRVFCAKDIKSDRQIKVFIDVSNVLVKEPEGYKINSDVLLSYLVNAKASMYYALKPQSIVGRQDIKLSATMCFATLFTHIVDYIGKISIIEYAKDKCMYLSARYFLSNILNMENEDQIRSISRKISGIAEVKENTYDFMIEKLSGDEDVFSSPKAFTNLIAAEFKIDKLTFDLVLEKWMFQYGEGTGFGIEFFPAFSAMMTDAYVGAYINNQKTIEKICGKNMVEYSKNIIYDFGR